MPEAVTLADLHWLRGHDPVAADDVPLPRTADVVIIGGGYVGGATAYWLAKRGVAAVLLERRGVSTGATGRNAGFIAPGLGMAFPEAVARFGRQSAIERLNFTRTGRNLALQLIDELAINCDLEASGGLTLAASATEWQTLRASGEALREAGFPIEVLERQDLPEHLYGAVPALFHGALYNPETLLVNPARLNNGIVRGAQALGARLCLGVNVTALVDTHSGIRVETDHGAIEAGHVVMATNAWTPLLEDFFVDRIRPVRGQVLATEPAPPIFRRAMSTNYGYEYWSQRQDGTIVLGGARWAAPDRDEGYYAEDRSPLIQEALYHFLTETFPALRGVPLVHRWSGIMGFSRDSYPFIGPMPGRPRLLVAAGFTGHGGPYFAVAGSCIADLIVDGRSDQPVHNYALDRELEA